MRLLTSDRQSVQLMESFAKGGEAAIWSVYGRPEQAAKIYHRPTAEKESKLAAMLANPPVQGRHPSVAWPQEMLYTDRDKFVGFLMPRVPDSLPLFHYYNPARRAQLPPAHLPDYPWPIVLNRVARNLAAAVAGVHARGHVIGDLNESNVLVNPRGLVTLVDADSFQIRESREVAGFLPGSQPRSRELIHRNPVGKPEFTPPELQGIDFKNVDRTPVHDHFGLAALLFYLLMEGRHPYAGVLTRDEPTERVDLYCLRLGIFPYDRRSAAQPPPGAPPFAWLPPTVQLAFVAAFANGQEIPHKRPSAEAWREMLDEAAANQRICAQDRNHIYSHHLAACPHCQPIPVVEEPIVEDLWEQVWRWRQRITQPRQWQVAYQESQRQALAGREQLTSVWTVLVGWMRLLGKESALVLQWVGVNGFGVLAGAFLAWGFVWLMAGSSWSISDQAVAGLAGSLFGLGLGWIQWLALEPRWWPRGRLRPSVGLRRGTRWLWVAATTLGGGVVGALVQADWVAGRLPQGELTLFPLSDPANPILLLAGMALGPLFGLAVGFLQSQLLAHRLTRSQDRRIWTLANGLSWGLALDGWLIGQIQPLTPWAVWPMDAGLAGLAGTAAGALVTGLVLIWLLAGPYRHPRRQVHQLWRPSRVDVMVAGLESGVRRWLTMILLLVGGVALVQGGVYLFLTTPR